MTLASCFLSAFLQAPLQFGLEHPHPHDLHIIYSSFVGQLGQPRRFSLGCQLCQQSSFALGKA